MSEQLIGVIVGALIGFAGTALITLLQWRIEREKRREDRSWRYRQERVQDLRVAWEEVRRLYLDLLEFEEKTAKHLDRLAAAEDSETYEEIQERFKEWSQKEVRGFAGEEGEDRFTELMTNLVAIASVQDPSLQQDIIKATRSVMYAMGTSMGSVQSLLYKFDHGEELSSEDTTRAVEQCNEVRAIIAKAMTLVETAIERYVTKL